MRLRRILTVLCLAAAAGQILWLWAETGRAGLTRYHDPLRARQERHTIALNALLDGPDAAAADPPVPESPNEFALGLLPFGMSRHAISVLTLLAPLLVAAILAVWPAPPSRAARSGTQRGAD